MEPQEHHIADYFGELKNGRMTGNGTYFFNDETRYEGDFKDGLFHGSGVITYASGARYEGKWNMGKEIEGKYFFCDGMAYDKDPFEYLVEDDQRYYQEHLYGLRPATLSLLSAACDIKTGKPLHTIPDGCYDTGDGIYDSLQRVIYHYSDDFEAKKFEKFRRFVTDEEHIWIVTYCRKGWDERVGYGHPRFSYKSEEPKAHHAGSNNEKQERRATTFNSLISVDLMTKF